MKTRMTWTLALWLMLCLACNYVIAAAPADWNKSNIDTTQFNESHTMTIMARVYQNGAVVKTTGSKVAVFIGDALRGVADFDGTSVNNGVYYNFFYLDVACSSSSESGYAFKYYNPTDDTVYDLTIPSEYTSLPFSEDGYGDFDGNGDLIPFVLTLPAPPQDPTITVTITPSAAVTAGAQWKIDSGSWNNSGATVASTAGTHTISFKDVTGYTTPASQSVTLNLGDKITRTGTYVPINPTVKYTLSPNNAQWKIDSGSWNNSGATVTTTAGTHTIT
ncbi:MAG: hypothetical protein IJT83_13915, partial [Victivallales bacterium]|nr:hypothetical protein [Victivallales bacterium]